MRNYMGINNKGVSVGLSDIIGGKSDGSYGTIPTLNRMLCRESDVRI